MRKTGTFLQKTLLAVGAVKTLMSGSTFRVPPAVGLAPSAAWRALPLHPPAP